MAWFYVTDGAPPEPSYDDLLSGNDQPQPHELMKRLFKELTGTSLAAARELVREDNGGYEKIARGYAGNQKVGCAWSATIPVDDTSLPVDETYVTYGLPTVTLIWSVAYRKRGQLGYATWTLSSMVARLDGDAREVLERVWSDVFGVRPVLVPAPVENTQACEDRARKAQEQLRADLRSLRRAR